ncbi:hypothetical protein [Pseudoclavibacter sp. AY1F1]|uniref:hypothetical protein n=1 Tax=Pseudoclavibacter sp. AY1F1 TaxID=2080583 RepID=UPI0011B0D5A2|nr:hypothetical protein [Pseudoclavibacter sp. AY1F1]
MIHATFIWSSADPLRGPFVNKGLHGGQLILATTAVSAEFLRTAAHFPLTVEAAHAHASVTS